MANEYAKFSAPTAVSQQPNQVDKDWDAFWSGSFLRCAPRDPEYQGQPRTILLEFSGNVTINVHGLFFQLAAFGELESVGVISDSLAYAQYMRARDAAVAKTELHERRVSEMTTVVSVSKVPTNVANTTAVAATFSVQAVPHHPTLVFFDPLYIDKLKQLMKSFFPHVEEKETSVGRRNFLFFTFANFDDAAAALATIQLPLAHHWDIHVQLITNQVTRIHGTTLKVTTQLLPQYQSLPTLNVADSLNTAAPSIPLGRPPIMGNSPPPAAMQSGARIGPTELKLGQFLNGLITKTSPEILTVDIGCSVPSEVHIRDVDNTEAFRQLQIGNRVIVKIVAIALEAVRCTLVLPAEAEGIDIPPLHPAAANGFPL